MPKLNHKIQQLASEFWKRATIVPSYPIKNIMLEQAVILYCPLSIVKINQLSFNAILHWLSHNGFVHTGNGFDSNSNLYGLLFVNNGTGFIFINGAENSAEQLFTLAHEISHYILDYEQPKLKLIQVLGRNVVDVLNGLREPTFHEQLQGVIKGIDVKSYIHLIERKNSDSLEKMGIWNIENNADLFAMELLAPYKMILQEMNSLKQPFRYNDIIQNLPVILENKYGFPFYVANIYAKKIAYALTEGDSFLNHLGY